jgi:hypothetical protein
VAQVSEKDKSLPWTQRKASYLDHLKKAPMEALAISCADKIHNLWSLILAHRSGQEVWSVLKMNREKQLNRFEKMAALFRERFDHPLRKTFEETLETLKKEC